MDGQATTLRLLPLFSLCVTNLSIVVLMMTGTGNVGSMIRTVSQSTKHKCHLASLSSRQNQTNLQSKQNCLDFVRGSQIQI